jgi:hypothetical protein
MSQDMLHENLALLETNNHDETIFVAADIENGQFADLIGMRKYLANLGEILPSDFLDDFVPGSKGFFRIRVFLPEQSQWFYRNNMQGIRSSGSDS